jgi:hypothetical protein
MGEENSGSMVLQGASSTDISFFTSLEYDRYNNQKSRNEAPFFLFEDRPVCTLWRPLNHLPRKSSVTIASPGACTAVPRLAGSLVLATLLDHSMEEDQMCTGDLLVVDRSVGADPGDIVVVRKQNVWLVGRFYCGASLGYLVPSSHRSPFFVLPPAGMYSVFGVVTDVIRDVHPYPC